MPQEHWTGFPAWEGLDSYGAEPPNANAVRASKEDLGNWPALYPAVDNRPICRGWYSIYFMTGHRTVYIESYNQGLRHS